MARRTQHSPCGIRGHMDRRVRVGRAATKGSWNQAPSQGLRYGFPGLKFDRKRFSECFWRWEANRSTSVCPPLIWAWKQSPEDWNQGEGGE
jgi:hypothetical protein